MEAIIFDLDDTLVLEEVAATTAFLKSCLYAQAHYDMNLPGFQLAIRSACRIFWQDSPVRDYCVRVGIGSEEGLWASFAGPGQNLALLRRWAPVYRKLCWTAALQRFKIEDEAFALKLAAHYAACREELQVTYRDAEPVLESLRPHFKLGLLTNGAPDLQRRKIKESGLEQYFDAIVVSGEYGVGKPDRRIFEWMLALLDVHPEDALMVGNSLMRDVAGASAAGIHTAWLNRLNERVDGTAAPDYMLTNLYDLRAILEGQLYVIPVKRTVAG